MHAGCSAGEQMQCSACTGESFAFGAVAAERDGAVAAERDGAEAAAAGEELGGASEQKRFPRPRGATPKDPGGMPKEWDERTGVWRTLAEDKHLTNVAAAARERKKGDEGEERTKRGEHFMVNGELGRGTRKREQASRYDPRFDDGKERAKRPVLRHEDFCFMCK